MAAVASQLDFSGVLIIAGNYGSGKTEVAVNLAVDQQRPGRQVSIADLDLVNPYFRTREARNALTDIGVSVVLPPESLLQADLPILTPQVAGLIRNPGDLAILDAGGDDVGVTVLAALTDVFRDSRHPVRMLQVVNPLRPTTNTIEGCLKMRAAIEAVAQMPVSGWIGNTHMLAETTADHINEGYQFLSSLAGESKLPLTFITAAVHLLDQVTAAVADCPVLPIFRQLVPPWQKAVRFAPDRTH